MTILIVDGVEFESWTPRDEENEFHSLIKAQSTRIFGKDTIYFDVKTSLKSASGISSIPDAYVIKLTEPYEWYVVENELSTHPVYDHVVKQLTKFINGIENKDSRNKILDILYEQIDNDNNLRSLVSTKIGNVEIYRFLSKLIFSNRPRIVVIIDEIILELEEAIHSLSYTPELVEFKTFVRKDNSKSYAHLFQPLYRSKGVDITTPRETPKQNWEVMLNKMDISARSATVALLKRINELDNVVYKGKNSCSAYIHQQRVKYGFAGLIPNASELRIYIRTDQNLYDPKGWVSTKADYWFTSKEEKQEREFKINDESQVDYAFELIKQSYEITRKKEFGNKY